MSNKLNLQNTIHWNTLELATTAAFKKLIEQRRAGEFISAEEMFARWDQMLVRKRREFGLAD